MNNECKCQIPNTDLAGRCFKCGGNLIFPKTPLPMSNNRLPADVSKRIWRDAEKYTEEKVKAINEEHFNVYWAYIAGATAEHNRLDKIFEDTMQRILNIASWADDPYKATLLRVVHNAQEQWKGTGKEQFTGSTFASPAPGITLGCISPEARELLDTIMEQWEGHYKTVKTDTYEPTFYGFAYWLVRWSGLVQPANTNPQK